MKLENKFLQLGTFFLGREIVGINPRIGKIMLRSKNGYGFWIKYKVK